MVRERAVIGSAVFTRHSVYPLARFRPIECDSGANQLFERRFVNRIVFMDVDGPARIALETRIEETSRVFQRSPVK
jgi:hypothetical protein